jgi:hypothetical protein
MAGAVRTYNPSRILVIYNGVPLSGFADGTFVNITTPSDGITTKMGADGELARAINPDRRTTVTITLQQTSPSNDILSGFYSLDTISCGGGVGPIMIQDLCGDTLFAASAAWIVKPADVEFSNEITNRAWQIATGVPSIYNVGGSASSLG